MGKHYLSSKKSTVQFQDNAPSCMWGMLQLLDYHPWHNIRNLFPQRKHHARFKRKNPSHFHGEDHHQFGVAETEPLLVRQHSQNLNATTKSSPKSSNENSCKEENPKDNHLHVLEVFRMEKDLFLNFFEDLDVDGKNFHQASNNIARLTKSVSFPQTSHRRNVGSSTLGYKQNEIWAFPKGEKLLSSTQSQRRFTSSFAHDISFVKPMPLESDHVLNSAVKEKPSFSSSLCYSQGLNHQVWNKMALHRFKMIKQKIKHAIREFKKSGYRTSVEAIHHNRASSEYEIVDNSKEDSASLDDSMIQEYTESRSSDKTKASDYDSREHVFQLKGRSLSINESLDRYTQLFEQSFNKDTMHWHSSMSKSLKLVNEDKDNNISGSASIFFRRNLSLPNPEPFGFLLHEALSNANDIRITVETDIDVQRKSVSVAEQLYHLTETKMMETVDKDSKNVNPSPISGKIVVKNDKEVVKSKSIYPRNEVITTLESSSEGNPISYAEGRELNSRGSSMDELLTVLPKKARNKDASTTEKGTNIQSDAHNDSNFKYVKDVLEFFGLMGKDDIQMWHQVDQCQKLKPSLLLMDLDASLCHKLEPFREEAINPNHYQLLFNVVKEVVLEIYEGSPIHITRSFFNSSCLYSMNRENYILNEVWSRVNSCLSLRREQDHSVDDVVGRNLAKSGGWIKLQQEEEHVVFELEGMIVDDLLNEVIFL